MIIREEINGFIKTYSDNGFKIRKVETGELFNDAVDVLELEYEETNVLKDTELLNNLI